MPEKISDVGHKVIDAKEDDAQRESNAVKEVINDIEDQTGQSDLDWIAVLEKCIKNPDCNNPFNFDTETENLIIEISGKACLRDLECSIEVIKDFYSYINSCKYQRTCTTGFSTVGLIALAMLFCCCCCCKSRTA